MDTQFAEKGGNVVIYPDVTIIRPDNIYLKSHIIISEYVWIIGGIKTIIGNFVHISNHSSISGGGVCIVEDFVGFSAGVRVITGSEIVDGSGLTNPTIPVAYRAITRSYVHLQRHVFLATNVIVHPNVTIGEGAVIGSGSVVTKDIEPWTINVGIPAVPKKTRPKETMKRLERMIYGDLHVTPFDVGDDTMWKRSTIENPSR